MSDNHDLVFCYRHCLKHAMDLLDCMATMAEQPFTPETLATMDVSLSKVRHAAGALVEIQNKAVAWPESTSRSRVLAALRDAALPLALFTHNDPLSDQGRMLLRRSLEQQDFAIARRHLIDTWEDFDAVIGGDPPPTCSLAEAAKATGRDRGTISRWGSEHPELIATRDPQGRAVAVYVDVLHRLAAERKRRTSGADEEAKMERLARKFAGE